jgi:5-methylcytosine-specific restriction protein A
MYFYKTMAWLNKRAEVLERDNYECQMCKAEGRYGRGNVVHHIKHLTHRPDLALEDDNLVTLCERCHNKVHPEKLKRPGTAARERISLERW